MWIDVAVFHTLVIGLRLSGIQRLEFELPRARSASPRQSGVFFVRPDAESRLLVGIRGIGRRRQTLCSEIWAADLRIKIWQSIVGAVVLL
jgi:hypothetical protein